MDGERAKARQATGRHLKIGEQPRGAGRGTAREIGHDLFELVMGKTVEEEMRDDEIMRRESGFPVQGVGVNKLVAVGIQSGALKPVARRGEHPGAGVNDGDARGGEFPPAFDEEAAVAFAHDQDVLRVPDMTEKRGAAALQFVSREEQFHPAVVPGQ